MSFTAGVYNELCDICNNLSEPILNPALDPSDCFIMTDRMYTKRACGNITGNISHNFYFSNADLMDDIQTNLLIHRLNNTNRPICQQQQRPIFKTHKERMQYLKYYRERALISSLGSSTAYYESKTN